MKFSKDMFSNRNLYVGFLHVAVIVLALQVMVLARQNNDLKNPSTATEKERLKEGDYFYYGELEPVRDGIVPDTAKSKQLVFVFTTRCPFCKETIPLWKQLAEQSGSQHSIIGISLDPIEQTAFYIAENKIDYPVFVPKHIESFKERAKTSSVPTTIVRNKSGLVEKAILGKLKEEQLNEISNVVLAVHN